MSDRSSWLDNCFDNDDRQAPMRAYFLGATLASVAAVISSVAVDPTDWKMLLALLAGATVFGGGCFAMFASPPERFRRMCSLGLDLWGLLPLKLLLGLGLLIAIPMVISLFVAILASIAALDALVLTGRSWARWVFATEDSTQ